MDLKHIFSEIESRRSDQDAQWGGPAHDDEHCPQDWMYFVQRFVGKARVESTRHEGMYERRLIDIAALAIAALQSSRRKRGVK